MNKIEQWKIEQDGLDVRERIHHYAKHGWQAINEADVQRLKWYGLFLRNPTPGYFMLRVRIPGGQTHADQLATLAGLAQQYGNGVLDVTTRSQIQLRHLRIEHVPTVFERLQAVGLSSLQTGMDNVRNIMGCAVDGLSPDALLEVGALVRQLSQAIVGDRAYSNLPRKFNVAVTGCLDNCLHLETQDLALVPARQHQHGEIVPGFNVLAGGKLGSGGYRIASPLDVFVTLDEAAEVCLAVISIFRDHGPREARTTSRLAFLLEEWGERRFRDAIEAHLGRPLTSAGTDARTMNHKDHIGIYRQRQTGLNYVGLKIPVGRISADDLLDIARLAERYGSGEVRLSAGQSVIIPAVPDRYVGELAEERLLKRLTYNPSPLHKGLVSCVGNDYCNLAVIETKGQAIRIAAELDARMSGSLKPISMHWSGCPAGCGNHLVADIGLLGKKAKVNGRVVEAVDVFVGGRSGPQPKPAIKLLEDVPCDQLASVLAGIVPYHSREKMHRARAPGEGSRRSLPVREPAPAVPTEHVRTPIPSRLSS